MVYKLEELPPKVAFEKRLIEDRDATLEKGEFIGQEVHIALISPAGSRDRIERIADEWLAHIQQESRKDRFPVPWVKAFRESYEAWKKGVLPPSAGTLLTKWGVPTEKQVQALQACHITTVEELAVANEETIRRLGMGARDLKNKARAALDPQGAAAQDSHAANLQALKE